MTSTRGRRRIGAIAAGLVASISLGVVPSTFGALGRSAVALPNPLGDVAASRFSPTASVSAVSAWLTNAISLRQSALGNLANSVAAEKALSSSDHAMLVSIVSSAASGLSTLAAKVPTDTTIGALGADAATMVLNYHVFSIITPEVDDLIAVGGALSSVETLVNEEPGVDTAITTGNQPKATLNSEQTLYRTLNAKLTQAMTLLDNLKAALFAISPQTTAPPQSILGIVNSQIGAASTDAAVAQSDLQAIVRLLAEPAPPKGQKN